MVNLLQILKRGVFQKADKSYFRLVLLKNFSSCITRFSKTTPCFYYGHHDKSPYEVFTEKQINEAFEVFDEGRRGRAKLKHLGTVLRSLGRVPDQQTIETLTEKVHDPENPGYFTLVKLIPPLSEILMNDELKSATKENLMQALKVVNTSRDKSIKKDQLEHVFSEHARDYFTKDNLKSLREYLDAEYPALVNYEKYADDLVAPQLFDIAESRRKIREKLVDNRYRMC